MLFDEIVESIMSEIRTPEILENGNSTPAAARYCSGSEVSALIALLLQFRDLTQSTSSHRRATELLKEFGAGANVDLCTSANYANLD